MDCARLSDSPGKRLSSFRSSLGLSQRAFAMSIGVSGGLIGQLEADIAPPSRSFLQKISDRYRISADWLLNGAGEMRTETADTRMIGVPMSEFVQVPILEASLSAGHGAASCAEDVIGNLAFRSDWLKREGVQPGSASLVRVKGDSMEPTLRDGAMVLVDHLRDDATRKDIYALRIGDDVLVKRLHRQGEVLFINSDNPTYDSRAVTGTALADVKVIGRVVWQGYTFRSEGKS